VAYAAASAIAKVVSGAGPVQVVVQPYAGATTYFPILNSGELDLGFVSAPDMVLSYQRGAVPELGGKNPYPHTPNVRLVMRGAPIITNLLVKKDSPIRTIRDVKGTRVTGQYPAQLLNHRLIFAYLASAGMGWEDVKVIPVPAVNEGVDAMAQGRADASIHALNAAKVREAHAAVGVRIISADCSSEGEQRLRKIAGAYPRRIKAGGGAAVDQDSCMIAFDYYLATHRAAPEPVVATVLKALWDNADKLPPFHPFFKEWTRERAVDPSVTIPYHPEAIRFYQERGVWSPEMEQTQKRLLALNP
jgi:TRAP transporter TAXI family solute receptor